ncbi:MAG: carboxypeptidase-like regulatory domain-containing protein [Prevotella sp.]|nr:carboxypeptidase-like regulatory domain-containing protein [Prevotella sp.]
MRKILFTLYFILFALCAMAQNIRGIILDAQTGDSIPRVTVSYRGHHLSVLTDQNGHFTIPRHNGWKLTFSAVGYKSQNLAISENSKDDIVIRLRTDVRALNEVVVKSKRRKYSRKDNPAVAFMKRVIAAKKQNKLEVNPFYQYRNYEKLTIALNELSEHALDSGIYAKKAYLKNQIEKNPITDKYVLPVITTEKISRYYYRQDPKDEKTVIEAEKENGINDLIETGDLFTALAKDIFSEVDIYDNQVRILRQHFTSPIADGAVNFYRYYLTDTVKIDRDSCICVTFTPNNQQDFGFNGNLYITKDSALHVKKVSLRIPHRSDINFVKSMAIDQEYIQMADGQWVLSTNDMLVEMSLTGKFDNFLITRTSRRSDYSFEPVDKKIFRGKAKEIVDPYAQMRTKEYWADNRDIELTHGESEMDNFIKGIKNTKHFGWAIVFMKAILENYVELAKSDNPSKIDLGPVNSYISSNEIDGFRFKPAFQTTANLNPHLFLKGYVAHGFKSNKNYYSGTVTYSFNKKAYLPQEFPRKNLSFTITRDIASASDKFSLLDKDNLFASVRWSKVRRMSLHNTQEIKYEHENSWGLNILGGLKFDKSTAIDNLYYTKMTDVINNGSDNRPVNDDFWNHGSYRTSELYIQFTFSPGQQYMNSKQQRFPLNHEAPIFKFKHTIGIKGFMGGEYSYHVTEASIYKRLWVKNCGMIDLWVKGGIQWSKVPFPLLMAPAANLSLIRQSETFSLVTDMEFLNDRYVSFMTEWDLQGKILNRIPLLKRLKWREHIGINVLWGSLSDKNNPTLPQNQNDSQLMQFPEGSMVMDDGEPYAELRVGIHNILKFFRIDYVRRLNYNEHTSAPKNAIRLGFGLSF